MSSAVEDLSTRVLTALVEAENYREAVIALARVAHVCKGSKINQEGLGAAPGLIEAMIALALRYSSNVHVSASACAAIRYLCRHGEERGTTCEPNVRQLGRHGACEVLVAAMSKHSASARITENFCRAAQSLSFDENNSVMLGDLGSCEFIVEGMRLHGSTVKGVAEFGCLAIGNLAIEPANEVRLGKARACELLLEMMAQYADSSRVVEQACFAISNLCESATNKATFMQLGAGARIIQAMQRHISSSGVLEDGSNALCNLASKSVENKRTLNSLGALDLLRSISKNASTSSEARRRASMGMATLELIETPEQVMHAISKAGSKTQAALSTFSRIEELCAESDEKRSELGAAQGLVEAMLALASRHSGDERVVNMAIRAICKLANGNVHNQVKLGQAETCRFVVEALSTHASSSGIAKYGCQAVTWLALQNSSNKRTLLNSGAVAIVSALASNGRIDREGRESAAKTLMDLTVTAEAVSVT